jgi:eukaryotic-like serine/threonine-protein kinase
MLLYVSRDGDDLDIFLQRVGGANPINLTADCPLDDSAPAFSPDGNRIAFRSQREGGGLFVMGATGESPQRVSDNGFNPAWSPDGAQLVFATENVVNPYARDTISQLWILDLGTRESRLLFRGDAVGPSFSPSGRLVSFWAAIAGIRDIWTIPAAGGEPRRVTNDTHTDWSPFFSPDGRTLYFITDRSGRPNLWRVPMDESSGQALGPPSPVTSGTTPIDDASISLDGKRITFTAQSRSTEFLRFAFDPDSAQVVGEPTTLFASTDNLEQFDVSADGRRLAFRTGAPKEDLVIMETDGKGRRRLMDDVFRDRGPTWTRDGMWLMFYSNRGGFYDLWRIRPDGTGVRRLTDSGGKEDATNPQLSPDGRTMAATLSTEGGQAMVIWTLDRPISEIEEPLPLPATRTPRFSPVRFSPDQRLLAGWSSGANRLRAVASLYDLQTGEITILQTPDGQVFETWGMGSSDMDWIDEHRLLVWDDRRRSAVIWDIRTGSAREVPGVPGPCELRVIDAGRALIVSQQRTESDIWMLQLGDGADK